MSNDEKWFIRFWPILAPFQFLVISYLHLGALLYKLIDIYEDWGIRKTI